MHLPKWNEEKDENGEEHLEIGVRCEAEAAQNGKLDQLQQREEVHHTLGHAPDEVVRWVRRLQQ